MARGINKVILVGNVGKDPEVRYNQGGGAIANITLATSDTWRDKTTGEPQEKTEWHRVVFFGKLGEIVGQYVKKGSKIYVEGKLRTRKWQDQSGQDRYTTEVVADEMQLLDSRPTGQPDPQHTAHQQRQGGNTNGTMPSSIPTPPPAQGFDQFDDDIPF